MNFEELGLNNELIRAVQDMGFTEPTPIQEKAIPDIISGNKDLVGLAQTGTGKTAAFGLPMLYLTDFQSSTIQGLVICPTRELCIQISNDFKKYSRFIKGSRVVSVYGGTSIDRQIKQIKKGVQIIVATPGRLLDLIRRRVIKLSNVSYVVLDEADEMLNMGFKDELDGILDKTPDDKKTWLFSATMPREVARIAKNYMKNPIEITVGKKNSGASNIKHINYVITEKHRYQALKRIIDFYPDIFGLIFCRTRKDTQIVAEKLIKDGYSTDALHGDLSQAQRDNVMKKFRDKSIQILVATDVAARGLDVKKISHVINYNLPDEPDSYTHRSGRTARAGKSGISIAIMNSRERRKLDEIERKAGIEFKYKKVPDGNSVCEKQLFAMVEKLVDVNVNHEEIGKFLPPVYNALDELSKEELIQKFVSIEFNRFLNYYKDSVDINSKIGKTKISKKKKNRSNSSDRTVNRNVEDKKTKRFFTNVGKLDNINAGAIIRILCEKTRINAKSIGKIEILREFSFFEVEAGVSEKLLKSMKNVNIDGKKIRVEYAEKSKKSGTPSKKRRRRRRKSR